MRSASVASSSRPPGALGTAARSRRPDRARQRPAGRPARAGAAGSGMRTDGVRVEVSSARAEHVAMVALALQRQPEGGGGVRAALVLGLADHARQHDLDLQHLAGGRRAGGSRGSSPDGAHRAQVVERVDRLGPGGLEEELRDLGAALVEGLDAVGEVAAVGVGLAGERDLSRFASVFDPRTAGHGRAHCSLDRRRSGARRQDAKPRVLRDTVRAMRPMGGVVVGVAVVAGRRPRARAVRPGSHPARQARGGARHRPRRRRDHDELRQGAGHREARAVRRDGHRLVRRRPRLGRHQRPRRGSRPPRCRRGCSTS